MYEKCAKRIFHTSPYLPCAAEPRKCPAREGKAVEHQTLSDLNRKGAIK